ncbi:hypothetical protein GCM10009759_45490 [Kitasatospora saccharophila]|uniref:Uncharacterized protein n=1 Tax=Kitasatospora saccharophila TaxID=407973 RepID=A0ABN2X8P4_9ACTN
MLITTIVPQRLNELLADTAIPVAHRALWALLAEVQFNLTDLLSLDVRDAIGSSLPAAWASKRALNPFLDDLVSPVRGHEGVQADCHVVRMMISGHGANAVLNGLVRRAVGPD